jgi:hypothetical protein
MERLSVFAIRLLFFEMLSFFRLGQAFPFTFHTSNVLSIPSINMVFMALENMSSKFISPQIRNKSNMLLAFEKEKFLQISTL